MNTYDGNRRNFLKSTALAGSALIIDACGSSGTANPKNKAQSETEKKGEKEITAIEDPDSAQ